MGHYYQIPNCQYTFLVSSSILSYVLYIVSDIKRSLTFIIDDQT